MSELILPSYRVGVGMRVVSGLCVGRVGRERETKTEIKKETRRERDREKGRGKERT